MKFQFMKEQSEEFSIEKMAKVLKVSVNGYYFYIKRKPSFRAKETIELMDCIRTIYREGRCMYGSPRVYGKLRKLGIHCSRRRVAKLMKKEGLYQSSKITSHLSCVKASQFADRK